jgi:hypothetical protein
MRSVRATQHADQQCAVLDNEVHAWLIRRIAMSRTKSSL